jgi:membrane-associated HD superfamily phosphohydrolase
LEQHERVAGTKIYSAPRRFDLATVFVVTTAYCLLFASLSATTWPGYVNLIIAAFITLVGVGQAVIYRGLRPRQASIWVGIVLCNLGMIVYLYLRGRMVTPGTILGGFIYAAIGGAILGYLAGTLVGGIFLIIDFVRRRFTPPPETIPAELPVAISATPPSPEVS